MTVVVDRTTAPLRLEEAGALSPQEVLARLGTRSGGLSSQEVAERLEAFGRNVLAVRQARPSSVLLRQLRNPLLVLLIAAAVVSAFTGGGTNSVIIATIVAASVGLGFVNEYRAERAIDALRAHIRHDTEVRREGRSLRIPVTELVPGDVVALRMGDLVPADVRILEADDLECDEAVLTGESLPVEKTPGPVRAVDTGRLTNCAYMGTIVHQGSGVGVVVETGTRTGFGQIAAGLGVRPSSTAFQVGLARFSRLLFGVAGVLTAFIFIANVALSRPIIDALLFSLAIAIGIAPEMMPAIVTVSLASGSRALAAKKVLVKRLVAIEDLGNIELLFTDKTGTLTQGAMNFERAIDAAGQDARRPRVHGLVCNEATVDEQAPVGGNALDEALWMGATAETVAAASSFERLHLLPFDHERRLASVVAKSPDGQVRLITKGAPEAVLDRCVDLTAVVTTTLASLFSRGERVLAVASRAWGHPGILDAATEGGLTFEGFLTFADEPKTDAGAAIARLQGQGIGVKVITGDNGVVAQKVCAEIHMPCEGVLSGADIEAMDEQQLRDAIPTTTVFARVGPDQKSRIIEAARHMGKDVAFLGDGVNDAVALHHADVGISVDSATDVAKDAADIVLLDKDLGVLADGVAEGRRIFANTMKYVLMATSSNFGNMFSAAGASAFLSFLPMLPFQVLLNNLLYDTGQLAIPTDRVDPEGLDRPAAWDMRFITRFMLFFGPVSSIFDFATFLVMLGLLHAGHVEFRSGWFVESIATQTLVIYVIRTRRIPFVRSRPSLPMLVVPTGAALCGAVLPYTGAAHWLGFSPLPWDFFLIIGGMVVVYLWLVELGKGLFFHRWTLHRLPHRVPSAAERRERHLRRVQARFVHHHQTSTSRGSHRRG